MSTTWTVKDKRTLLIALQKHGTSNLEIIQKELPYKTISEIRYMFDKYSKLAYERSVQATGKSETYPIKKWIQVLKKLNLKQPGVVNVVPRVLKYISLYEKRLNNTDINLSDCYNVLSDLTNGLAPKEMDTKSNYFFCECLSKLASSLKNQDIREYKEYLKSLKDFNALVQYQRTYGKNNTATSTNPLKVPGNLLKVTNAEMESKD